MLRTISLTIALLAVVATAGWYLVESPGSASAAGIYDPTNIENTDNGPYYPPGPCDDGIDNDYDFLTDANDPDCLDPKPTNTPGPVNTPTQPPAPTATQGPPSLGGVAEYPDVASGGNAGTMALLVATAMLLSGGAAALAWSRVRR